MKLHKFTWQTAVTVLALATGAPLLGAEHRTADTTENRGQFTARDFRFVTEAAEGGMMEVRLGELGKQKASSQGVRDFAQRMIADHSKANDELKGIVEKKGATLPTKMTRRENSEIDRLEKLSGADFDKEYTAYMVKDHKKDLKEFQDATRDVSDPDLKDFAQKTATVIQGHLDMARGLETAAK